jgi:hypothetical protein
LRRGGVGKGGGQDRKNGQSRELTHLKSPPYAQRAAQLILMIRLAASEAASKLKAYDSAVVPCQTMTCKARANCLNLKEIASRRAAGAHFDLK